MRRIFTFGFVASCLFVLGGCGQAGDDDGTGQAEGAQTAKSDVLAACPNLEDVALSTVVVGDKSIKVRQSYKATDDEGRVIPGKLLTYAQNPATSYQVRFYRDASGHSKFQLQIGTFLGMQSSIEGSVKAMTLSGTVSFSEGSTTDGQLVVTSRRDNYRALLGDVTTIRFDHLDCAGADGMNLEAPLITLEKTSDATVEITESSGKTELVTPVVRWTKKADQVELFLQNEG